MDILWQSVVSLVWHHKNCSIPPSKGLSWQVSSLTAMPQESAVGWGKSTRNWSLKYPKAQVCYLIFFHLDYCCFSLQFLNYSYDLSKIKYSLKSTFVIWLCFRAICHMDYHRIRTGCSKCTFSDIPILFSYISCFNICLIVFTCFI